MHLIYLVRRLGFALLVCAIAAQGASAAVPADGMNGFAVGDYAFDFPAFDQNGVGVTLYQYSGGYVVLDYCAEWCPPCRALSPVLEQVTSDLNATGIPEATLDMLLMDMVNRPSTAKVSKRWAAQLHTSFPVLNVGGDANAIAFSQWLNYSTAGGLSGGAFPVVVVLSPAMKILSVDVGLPVSVDQMPEYLHQIIDADLTTDPQSGLAEAVTLTTRRQSSAIPFPLSAPLADHLLNSLGRIERNVTLTRTEAARGQLRELERFVAARTCASADGSICSGSANILDATFGSQLTLLLSNVGAALHSATDDE